MRMNYFSMFASGIIALFIIIGSCSAQVRKELSKDGVAESKGMPVGQPKIMRSQVSLNDKGNNVHCGLQDQTGNLWFGTTGDGIFKYDGKLFTQFTTSSGLNSNTIWCILEDKNGKIWIGTADGVCMYDHGLFTRVKIPLANDSLLSKYDVWSIMQDKTGKLWFATQVGVYIYDGTTFTSFTVTEEEKSCYFEIETVFEDAGGNFWFGGRCNPGVFKYDGKSITHLRPNGDDWAWPVLQDRSGYIWFSSWKGAYRYDGKSFKTFTKKDGLSADVVTRIMEDKHGTLWFGGDGLCRYDGSVFTGITKDGLANSGVWAILEDNAGRIWVGTRETGLYLYDGRGFTKFSE